ncbi:MAG: hypothetical protein ACRDV4_02320 [Acidimicrobiales bacterium]
MTSTNSELTGTDDESERLPGSVELGLPARAELIFLARMTAVAVASRADFGYDQIEDLRLALDELCLTLLEGAREGSRLQLRLGWSGDAIEVTATLEGNEPPLQGHAGMLEPNELSERILDSLVDEHGFDRRDGCPAGWLRMSSPKANH